ncbi:phosphatase PAP2 family protein [Spirosoma sp. KCTC 42546]|uniref:phosphatase PAP2 family protein n=1 Tax=Spirosoma sp. KCTC 42546 TaxID=2520506 RepID=UPI0011595CBC|nr:phosphatase PAP2 family protein [Spirosoma sp. KCTC 42546]QDK78195.1 phosphatase PAP2 family protein [Spirosoma sp. KCTC 42546]
MKARSFSILLSALLLWTVGCKEPIIDEGVLPFIVPTSVDADGGTWRTIILKSATDITVPQPVASTSDTYKHEFSDVKNGVLAATPEQNTAVNYWAAGGVIRWNQIARQLVAKYNIAPGYDYLTGQTTSADAGNPYAGPPFAARVYALLSVAQYDALVVAWRAKYQYNRPSLEQQGIVARVPILNVPSYPSEDAAIAEASCQMLAYFFPNEASWLKAKATEHKQSRLWAGGNVPSDLKAGEDLGATLVTKVIDRAKNDRFTAATDPTNSWQTALSKAPYDQKWKSIELPERAPILPLAGKVKTWYDSTAIVGASPATPPATTSAEFQKALSEVRDLANSRTRDQWRIASYWDNGPSTYSLSGLWNFLVEDLIRQEGQNELRTARTYALLNRAMQDATIASWRTMYTYFVPRPSQIDPTIKTATPIPNAPGYVADRAAVSTAAVAVLACLFPDEATRLNAQATEAALSGLYSGTHFRFDADAGTKLGTVIGQLAVTGAKADGAK